MVSTKSSGFDTTGAAAAAAAAANTAEENRTHLGRQRDRGEFLAEENGSGNLAKAFAVEEGAATVAIIQLLQFFLCTVNRWHFCYLEKDEELHRRAPP